MEEFRVIITGCRNFSDYDLLCQKCDHFLTEKVKTHKVIVVSGHEKGADALIAFWDGKFRGTRNIIDFANLEGIPVKVVRIDDVSAKDS